MAKNFPRAIDRIRINVLSDDLRAENGDLSPLLFRDRLKIDLGQTVFVLHGVGLAGDLALLDPALAAAIADQTFDFSIFLVPIQKLLSDGEFDPAVQRAIASAA